ncbi:hypothetical protein GCM10009867_27440 [Pedococcus aerophilus]|uniref:Secreted protein n=1 Tax=Pedococcus aerophilus TaxID=436356 RepID=A0ABP6H981_9MICO
MLPPRPRGDGLELVVVCVVLFLVVLLSAEPAGVLVVLMVVPPEDPLDSEGVAPADRTHPRARGSTAATVDRCVRTRLPTPVRTGSGVRVCGGPHSQRLRAPLS